MSASPSPVVANWELVLRLRERREQLGVSVNDITKKFGFTRNYWSAIENERRIIPKNTLETVVKLLEFGAEERGQLLELREAAKESGWWSPYSALLDSDVQRLLGLENGAQEILGFETLLIPGLLQTADYTRAILDADAVIRKVEIDQRVQIRLRRQERLRGDDPLHLTAIISEATLRQQIGGKTVLKGQLDHLLSTIDRHPGNVEIRVIPFTASACNLFGAGTLHLLNFHSARLPMVAWQETVTNRGVITDANQVRDISAAFHEALTHTLDRRRTREMINRYRKEMR